MIEPQFLDTSFWDVVLWMVWVFFLTLAIWIFIAVFSDIFRRRDLSGWEKALWSILIILLPLLGTMIYLIVRPFTIEEGAIPPAADLWTMYPAPAASSPSEEIAKAHDLLQKGAISQAEFDQIKGKALG